jgi:hypothetical protein
MKRILLGAAAATVAVLVLTGCSTGPKSYSTLADLKKAYISAGGSCAAGQSMDLSSIAAVNAKLKGLQGVTCNSNIAMFLTKNKTGRDVLIKMFSGVASAQKVTLQWVYGNNWMVGGVSFDAKKFADKLGGQIKK